MKTNFRKAFLKVVIITAFFAIVFAPALALAEIKLELNYPSLPGISDLTESTKSLPMALRYYVQLGVIIAILVCIVSLVWAGVSYISSSGQPGAMKQARERIFNTFIGLAILIGSFIILKTISPQMSLLSIVKPSIPTGGIVLLSKNGYTNFNGNNLGDLIESGDIKPIGGDIAKLSEELGGPLKEIIYTDASGNPEPKERNYPNFRLYAIGFWGEVSTFYEVTLFSDENFSEAFLAQRINKGDRPIKFTYYDGSIKADGSKATLSDKDDYFQGKEVGLTDKMKIFVINGHTFTGDGTEGGSRNQAMGGSPATDFPPQSIRIEDIRPGPSIKKADGSKTIISGSNPNTVDEGAVAVNMTNKVIINGQEITADPLYIASDDTNYEGNKAIYFQYRTAAQLQNVIPKLYFSSDFFPNQNAKIDFTNEANYNALETANIITEVAKKPVDSNDANKGQYLESFKFGYYEGMDVNQFIITYGKKDVGKGVDIKFGRSADSEFPYDGIYGAINSAETGKPSPEKSRYLGEISNTNDACREVTICKRNAHCLRFVPAGTKVYTPTEYVHFLPMPFFRPINLPEDITSWGINSKGTAVSFNDNFNDGLGDGVIEVQMKGKCLVVLFEKRINFAEKNNQTFKEFATAGGVYKGSEFTGEKSIIIPPSQTPVSLQSTKAMQCTTGGNRFTFWNQGKDPCASSIVVFPIK